MPLKLNSNFYRHLRTILVVYLLICSKGDDDIKINLLDPIETSYILCDLAECLNPRFSLGFTWLLTG